MASPQVEDGFTRIANELLEAAIRFNFTARQYKIVLYIWRNTYGMFGRKNMILYYQPMAAATGLARNHIGAVMAELETMNVLVKSVPSRDTDHRIIAIAKDYSAWRHVPSRDNVPSRDKTRPKSGDALPIKKINKPPYSPPQKSGPEYPEWLDLDRWRAFKEHRVKMKKPMTSQAEALNIKLLEQLIAAGHSQETVIDTTIMQGWQGLPKWWLETETSKRLSIVTQADRDAAQRHD